MHWALAGVKSYTHWLGLSFGGTILHLLGDNPAREQAAARAYGCEPRWFIRLLTDPPNMKLSTVVRLARSVGQQVVVVAYKANSPVLPEMFIACWEKMGCPTTMFDIEELVVSRKDSTDG